MMDVLLDFAPELVTLIIAIIAVVARTTDNQIDDKVARLAERNESKLKGAVKRMVDDNNKGKK